MKISNIKKAIGVINGVVMAIETPTLIKGTQNLLDVTKRKQNDKGLYNSQKFSSYSDFEAYCEEVDQKYKQQISLTKKILLKSSAIIGLSGVLGYCGVKTLDKLDETLKEKRKEVNDEIKVIDLENIKNENLQLNSNQSSNYVIMDKSSQLSEELSQLVDTFLYDIEYTFEKNLEAYKKEEIE